MSAFPQAEYEDRLAKTRAAMEGRGIDVLLVTDPANLYYLTGYDAWSFYVPQAVIVPPATSRRSGSVAGWTLPARSSRPRSRATGSSATPTTTWSRPPSKTVHARLVASARKAT